MSSVLYSPNFMSSEAELRKNHTEFMDSNIFQQQQPQPQQQLSSGLMRYRSAPSSFLLDLVDNNGGGGGGGEDFRDFRYLRPSSPEVETVLARFISSCNGPDHDDNGGSNSLQQQQHQFEERPVKQEAENSVSSQNGYLNSSHQMIYQSQQQQQQQQQQVHALQSGSNLVRQSSSPAGFFPNITVDNGFDVMKEAASFRACNGTNGEASPSTSRLNNQFNISSGSPSYSRRMPQIAENGNGNMGDQGSRPDQSLGNANGRNSHYISNFPNDSWDNSEFSDLKRGRDNDGNKFSTSTALETQNMDFGHRNHSLTHHLSLPTHFETAAMEKFLQFQDSTIPCKIRAKRGFATHPRSIAERMRRTRISDRMKKLQDLFPNMDKQINTADMLDLAVDYIKDLQKEVKTLKDTKDKCVCSSKQKQY